MALRRAAFLTGFVIVLSGLGFGFRYWETGGDGAAAAGFGVFMAILGGMGVVSALYPQARGVIEMGFARALAALLLMAALLLPAALGGWVARAVIGVEPAWLQWPVLAVWLAFLAGTIGLIGWIREEEIAGVSPLWRVGGVFVAAFSVLFFAITFYGTLATILVRLGWIAPPLVDGAPLPVADAARLLGRLQDFFLWHAMKAVPALEIPATLRWDEPLRYQGPGLGWLLIAFKLTVIMPLLAACKRAWNAGKAPARQEK
jgi:hypothetical protein